MIGRATFVVLAMSLVAAAFAFDAARRKGASYDEPKHLATGASLLEHGRFVGDDNTPLTALFALPLARRPLDRSDLPDQAAGRSIFSAGAAFLEKNGVIETLRPARAISTAFFVVLILLLARLAHRDAGPLGALLAVGITAFDPTLLAHASLVSADLPLATATLAALCAWRRFAASPDATSTLLLTAAFALVLLSKLNGVIVLAVFGLEAVLLAGTTLGTRRLVSFVLAAGGAIAITAICFLGDPSAYFHGLARVARYGSGALPQYFDGTLGARSLAFYPAVLAFKVTPATILAVGALGFALSRRRVSRIASDRVTLLLLLAFVLAPIVSGYQQGIRFLLPALPLLALVAARTVTHAEITHLGKVSLVAVTCSLAFATAAFQHPHHLAYWNAFAGGSDRGDRWFVDSNGDWGQDVPTLARFVEEQRVDSLYLAAYGSIRPSAYGLDYFDLLAGPAALVPPRAGSRAMIVISDTIYRFVLAGGVARNDPLLPLIDPLSRIEPDFRIAHTMRGWWVTPELIDHLVPPR